MTRKIASSLLKKQNRQGDEHNISELNSYEIEKKPIMNKYTDTLEFEKWYENILDLKIALLTTMKMCFFYSDYYFENLKTSFLTHSLK